MNEKTTKHADYMLWRRTVPSYDTQASCGKYNSSEHITDSGLNYPRTTLHRIRKMINSKNVKV